MGDEFEVTGAGAVNILVVMRIPCQENDAAEFVAAVNGVVEGLLSQDAPRELIVVKINSWFGPKWLGFSGIPMQGLAVFYKALRIPPFVPNRVVSQRRFTGLLSDEVGSGEPLHRNVLGRTALKRLASEVAPGAMLLWYSGSTAKTGRGSMMVYQSAGDHYRSWYVQWGQRGSWHSPHTSGLKVQDLLRMLKAEPINSAAVAH